MSEETTQQAGAYQDYLKEVYDFWISIFQDKDVKLAYRLKASDLFNRAVRQQQQAVPSEEVRPNPYASLPIDELCKLAKHIA